MTKPRLLLAEDHELVGEGLGAALRKDYEVVAIVTDGADVIAEVARRKPDLLLLDLSLPTRNGLDLLPELVTTRPKVPVLILSMHVETDLVEMAMNLGADGFVPKNATIDELRTAIEEVLAGRRYVSPKLPKHSHRGGKSDPMGFNRLTSHQQRIVRMIAKGMNSKEIAQALGVTVWTVNFHRKNIRKELGVSSDLEMYRYAILAGVELPDGTVKDD